MQFVVVLKLTVSEGDTITTIMQARNPIQRYCFVFQPYPVNFADLYHPSFVEGKFCLHSYESPADVNCELYLGFPEFTKPQVLIIKPTRCNNFSNFIFE